MENGHRFNMNYSSAMTELLQGVTDNNEAKASQEEDVENRLPL